MVACCHRFYELSYPCLGGPNVPHQHVLPQAGIEEGTQVLAVYLIEKWLPGIRASQRVVKVVVITEVHEPKPLSVPGNATQVTWLRLQEALAGRSIATCASGWGVVPIERVLQETPAKPPTCSPWPPSIRAHRPTDRPPTCTPTCTPDPEGVPLDTILTRSGLHNVRASQPACQCQLVSSTRQY